MSFVVDILEALGLLDAVPVDAGWQKWIDKSAARISDGNDAAFFVGGDAFFPDMVAKLEAAADDTSLIIISGWSCDSTFSLSPKTTTAAHQTTLTAVLTRCNAKKATIRAMLWNNSFFAAQNTHSAGVINALSNGVAILDNRTPLAGAHHQKYVVLIKPNEAFAYCGGIDMDPNRTSATTFATGPLHDTQAYVEGPAALDIAATFIDRWNDHPDHQNKVAGDLTLPVVTTTFASQYTVQVGVTYAAATTGNSRGSGLLASLFWSQIQSRAKKTVGDMNVGGTFAPYAFAPAGETSVFDMIARGIANAKNFIYIEDQYLVSLAAATALAARIKQSDVKVIILACHPDAGLDLEEVWDRRKAFADTLRSVDPTGKQWTIAFLKFQSGASLIRGSYVHSKCWVFDDEFAIVGSANNNRRGYMSDSECAVGIYGPEPTLDDSGVNLTVDMFAKRFRTALWAKHLNLLPTAVADPVTAFANWFSPDPSARIATYNDSLKTGPVGDALKTVRGLPGASLVLLPYGGADNFAWDKILDPDGSSIP